MNSRKGIFNRVAIPVSFLILTLVAYWPLLIYSMKFDILDQYLPWRYLVGQCLQSGHLPLWNPYTHLGYPLYADPQSGAWYPVVWLIGGIFSYNIYWIQTEYLFHVWIAGCGMFLLTRALVKDEKVAWLAGASFMLSGFFTGNAQHITWIISGAWIPFILYFFLRMMKAFDIKVILLCAFCFFMLFTGGYPAFSIMMLYILFVLSVLIIARKIIKKENISFFLKSLFILIVSSVLLNAVMLVSVYESFNLAGRAEGLSRDLAMANPFSPKCIGSWLLPFVSVKDATFFETDISMSNGYFGLLMLAGFIASIFRKKSFMEKVILGGSLFFLFAAMGNHLPVRGWMYDFLPLLNLFRMPSLFRLFFIIGFILLASFTLKDILSGLYRDSIKRIWMAMLLFSMVLLLVSVYLGIDTENLKPSGYVKWLQNLKFNEALFLQSVITILILICFLFIWNKKKLLFLLTVDCILSAILCAPVTIVSDWKVKDVKQLTDSMPNNFRIPELTPMRNNIDRTGTIGPFWCNLGIWKKQPIVDGYNNFQTNGFIKFEKSAIASYILQNAVVYLSASSSLIKNNDVDTLLLYNDHTHLFVDRPLQNERPNSPKNVNAFSPLQLLQFTPSKIEAFVNNNADCYITLLQQYDNGWKVSIDDIEKNKFRSNGMFISTSIPSGSHKVTFEFKAPKVTIAFYVSAVAFFILLSILIINSDWRAIVSRDTINTARDHA